MVDVYSSTWYVLFSVKKRPLQLAGRLPAASGLWRGRAGVVAGCAAAQRKSLGRSPRPPIHAPIDDA
jgi:hypothetical protein